MAFSLWRTRFIWNDMLTEKWAFMKSMQSQSLLNHGPNEILFEHIYLLTVNKFAKTVSIKCWECKCWGNISMSIQSKRQSQFDGGSSDYVYVSGVFVLFPFTSSDACRRYWFDMIFPRIKRNLLQTGETFIWLMYNVAKPKTKPFTNKRTRTEKIRIKRTRTEKK